MDYYRLDNQLHEAGKISEQAKRLGKSLTAAERTLILEARREAEIVGYSRRLVEILIQEGRVFYAK